MKKEKQVTLNEKEYTIKKIPVGKFAQLMLSIDNLPSLVMDVLYGQDLENLTQQDMLTKVPKLLAGAQDEIFKLLSVASDIQVEEIEKFDFEEFIQLLESIAETNNLSAIIERAKGLGKMVRAQVAK